MPYKNPEDKKPATPKKGCLIFLLGDVVMVFAAGAFLLLKQLKSEHPAMFWTIIVIATGILAGLAAWGVGRMVRRFREKLSE